MEFLIEVLDQEVINEIARVGPDDQRAYLSEALRVGVLALRVARGEVDANLLKTRLDAALADLSARLREHAANAAHEIAERVRVELTRGGEDAREASSQLLTQLQGTERAHETEVRKTLDEFLGAAGPLRRYLAPESAQNVYAALGKVNEQLLQAFVAQVKRDVVGQFSLDDPASALNRLAKIVEDARDATVRQFSLDAKDSALSRLHASLDQRLLNMSVQQGAFEREVREAVATFVTRREEAARTTSHGLTFEQALTTRLTDHAARFGDSAENVGETTGTIRNCKVGDLVITMGSESGAPGARIVVEAKAAANYTHERIMEESATALNNRKASAALFVIAREYDTATGRDRRLPLERFGNVIIVRWDHELEETDVFLTAGVAVARAIAVAQERAKAKTNIDVTAIERAVANVTKKLEDLEDINTWATTIGANAEKIQTRVRTTRTQVAKDLETLAAVTDALH